MQVQFKAKDDQDSSLDSTDNDYTTYPFSLLPQSQIAVHHHSLHFRRQKELPLSQPERPKISPSQHPPPLKLFSLEHRRAFLLIDRLQSRPKNSLDLDVGRGFVLQLSPFLRLPVESSVAVHSTQASMFHGKSKGPCDGRCDTGPTSHEKNGKK